MENFEFGFVLPELAILRPCLGKGRHIHQMECPHLASWFRAKHPVGMQAPCWQNGTFRFKEKRALQGLDSRLISLGHQIALTNDILTN